MIEDAVLFRAPVPAGTEVYRFHTGSAVTVDIAQEASGWVIKWGTYEMSISASVPVMVEQVSWPDRVREPFIHQALKIRNVSPTSAVSLTTQLRFR
jgi:hypothetical protein